VTESANTAEKLPKLHMLGFGVGALPVNMTYALVILYLAYFYTDVFLLPPAVMAVLFVSCRVWDAINDPIMGLIIDKTNSRWGKFRPYLLFTPIPMIIFAALTFYVPEMGLTAKIIWAFVTYFGLQMIKTAMAVPYMAMPALMTTDATERTTLSSLTFIFGPLAFFLCSVLVLKVVGLFPSEKEGFFYTAIIFTSFSAIFSYVTFFATRKYDYPGNKLFLRQSVENKVTLRKNWQAIAQNRPFIVILCVFLLYNLITAITMGMSIYFIKYNLNMFDLYPEIMGLILLFSLVGAIIAPKLVQKVGKKNAIQYSNLLGIISYALLFFLSSGKGQAELVALWKMGGFCFLLLFLGSATHNVTPAVCNAGMADSVDFGEWKTGTRAQGFITSVFLMSAKAGMALGGAVIGLGLAFFDYLPNLPEYSTGTLNGILILTIGLPLGFRILISISMLFYNLSDSRMAEIIEELNTAKVKARQTKEIRN